MAVLDEEHLKKALWNLYWRGTAAVRQRIEVELDPASPRRRPVEAEVVDPQWTLREVRDFVDLARSGAYLAGDSRVTPRERTRWRFTFQRLVKDVELALRDDDIADSAAAMALLLDLAQETQGYEYFCSEDPIEAARVVVSDEVALLWSRVLDRLGFAELARSAAPQLVRWESEYGWTRTGFGRVREKETSLAAHPALGGPDLTYLRARLAHRRGEQAAARRLVSDALERLPGHQGYLGFANEIGARLPARAEAANHSRYRGLMSDEG